MPPPNRSLGGQGHGEPAARAAAGSVVARVLAELPEADRRRSAMRRRQQRQRLIALLVGTLSLVACLGPATSDVATHALAWVYAADVAWKGLVAAALGGTSVLPVLSSACVFGLSVVLWHYLLSGRRGGLL